MKDIATLIEQGKEFGFHVEKAEFYEDNRFLKISHPYNNFWDLYPHNVFFSWKAVVADLCREAHNAGMDAASRY